MRTRMRGVHYSNSKLNYCKIPLMRIILLVNRAFGDIWKSYINSHLQCWCVVCFAIIETCGYVVRCSSQQKQFWGVKKSLFLIIQEWNAFKGKPKFWDRESWEQTVQAKLSQCLLNRFYPSTPQSSDSTLENPILCVNGFEVLDLRKWYGWYCIGKWIRRIYNDMAIYQSLRLEKILDFTLTVDFLDTVYEVDWTHGLNG